jgi:uncharacterized membrane protein
MLWVLGFAGLTLFWMVASSLILAGAIAAAIVQLLHYQRSRRQRADYTAYERLGARYARGEIDGDTFATMCARLFDERAGAHR